MQYPRPQDILDGKVGRRVPRKAGKYHTLSEFMRQHQRMRLYLLVDFGGKLAAHYVDSMSTHRNLLNLYHADSNAKHFAAYMLSLTEHQESK